MHRSTLGPVSQGNHNARSSVGASALRMPRRSLAVRPLDDDRRASAMPAVGGRRSTAATANSSALRASSQVRQSTAFASSSRGLRQDPRPLNDRQFVQQGTRDLISFLHERGFENQLTPKTLSNPSTKDISSILVYLIHFIDPTFEFQKKMEEELPALIKTLGYPFAMSKSSLSAIGSPHMWPQILGFLLWLANLVFYDELCAEEDKKRDLDQGQRDAFFFQNVSDAFKLWMNREESFPELDQQMEDFFKEESEEREKEISELQESVESLDATVHALQTQPSPLQKAKDHLKALQANVQKFDLLLPSLRNHNEQLDSKVAEADKEIEGELAESERFRIEKERLTPILRRQEDDSIDAEHIASERESMLAKVRRAQSEQTRLEAEQKRIERACAEKHQEISPLVDEINQNVKVLDRLPSSLRNKGLPGSAEVSLSFSRDPSVTNAVDILGRDLDKDVVPAVTKLKEVTRDGLEEMQKEQLKLRGEIDELQEKVMTMQHDISLVKSQKEKREEEYEGKKKDLQESWEERRKMIAKQDEERAVMMQELEAEIREIVSNLEELVALHEAQEKVIARERAIMHDVLLNDIRLGKAHQEACMRRVLAVKKEVEEE